MGPVMAGLTSVGLITEGPNYCTWIGIREVLPRLREFDLIKSLAADEGMPKVRLSWLGLVSSGAYI